MKTWEEIKAYVERNGNVATITMEKLRNAHGSDRPRDDTTVIEKIRQLVAE